MKPSQLWHGHESLVCWCSLFLLDDDCGLGSITRAARRRCGVLLSARSLLFFIITPFASVLSLPFLTIFLASLTSSSIPYALELSNRRDSTLGM